MLPAKTMLKSATGLITALALISACSPKSDDAAPGTVDSTPVSDSAADAVAEMEKAIELAKSTSGTGSPALWTLADDDTTVHLFGTVHTLKPETEWRTDVFDAAFNAADKLVLEIAMESTADQQAVAMQMMNASLFENGQTLSDVLSEDEMAIVEASAKKLGIPKAAIDVQEPWAISLTLLNVQMINDGFDPSSGVEQVLTPDAKDQGKTLASLETPEFQIGVFDGMSMEAQIEMLVEGTQTMHLVDKQLSALVDEWADGDVEGLGVIISNPDVTTDEFYDALFVKRNEDWVPKIEALLEEPGTVMVAVGAGHLAGPDSVITMLEAKGHTLTRTQ